MITYIYILIIKFILATVFYLQKDLHLEKLTVTELFNNMLDVKFIRCIQCTT
jgi:hypothetical protein